VHGEDIGYAERDGKLEIRASSPGILEELAIDLAEHSSASAAAVDLELRLRGLDPTPLAGCLAPLGFAPDAHAIEARARVALELRPAAEDPRALALRLELSECALASEGTPAFGLERAKIACAALGPALARGLGLELEGLRVHARRNAAGELCFGGLRSIEPPESEAAPAAPAPASAPSAAAPLRWSLAGLALKGAAIEIDERRIELETLTLGAFDPGAASSSAALELLARAPGALRELALKGAFEKEGAQCGAELTFSALGLQPPQGAPLDLSGGGKVQFAVAADGVWTGNGSTLPLLVGAQTGLQRAGFEGLRFDPAGPALTIASLELSGLDGSLLRSVLAPLGIEVGWKEAQLKARFEGGIAQGVLSAHLFGVSFRDGEQRHASLDEIGIEGWKLGSGLRELGTLRVKGASCELARDEKGVLQAFGLRIGPRPATEPAAEPAAEPPHPTKPGFPKLPELGCSGIEVEGVRLHWTDRAQGRAVDTTLEAKLTCPGFAPGEALPFRVELHADALLEALALEGRLTPAPARLALDGKISAHGLAPTLGGYLPPGLELRSASDALSLGFHAHAEPAGESGLRAKLELSEFRWGEADMPAGLAFEHATLDLPQISPQAIEVAEISLRGLRGTAAKKADGSLVLAGLRLVEAPPAPAPAVEPAPLAHAAAPAHPTPLPHLSLGKLELELAGFELRDETLEAAAEPLLLAGSFATEGPLVLADAEPEKLPPLAFVLRGSATPFVSKVELRLTLEQWLLQPRFELHLQAQGLRGEGFREPGGGELEAQFSGSFNLARKGLGRFDLARPFSAELALEKLALRASPGGEVLAGIERVEAVIDRIDPRSGSVHAKSIEITQPVLRLERTSEGLRVCGLLVRSTPAPAPVPVAEAAAPAAAPAPSAPPPEIGVARIGVSGLDFQYLDSRVEPPLLVPLSDLEFELRGLTTRALREPRSLPFEISLRAGMVKLPPHGSVRGETERDLFTTCEVAGRMQLFPEAAGRVRLSIEDLQLVHFRTQAEQAGVHLEDGRLDLSLGVRFSQKGGLALDSVAVLAELEMSETENGPIQSALGLPLPIQAVLALVRDLEGNVRIPTRIELDPESVSKAEIVQALLTSISTILSRAILSSPFRVVSGLAGRVGVHVGTSGAPGEDELRLSFDEGSAELEGLGEAALRQYSGKLSADDRVQLVVDHSFSSADLARARTLSNPDLDDCRELSQRLRLKKAELARARAESAARVRVDLAVGRTREAREGAARLREIDAELGRSEESLDRVHSFLAEGAERKAAARLRAAARALANQRLERVRAALLGAGIDPARIVIKSSRIEPGEAPQGFVRLRLVRER
jgi:hypothetical protein